MTDQLPERIVAWPHGHWEAMAGECLVHEDGGVYLRADTAIPKAEADAIVAAALKRALDACMGEYLEDPQTDDDETYQQAVTDCCVAVQSLTPVAAEAAFEQAVREAVEAEREKWQTAVTLIERVYYMEGKDAKWRAAHMNGIARDVQNGLDLAWAKRMFPRDSEALSEARKVHSEEAAAIRAPQETSE